MGGGEPRLVSAVYLTERGRGVIVRKGVCNNYLSSCSCICKLCKNLAGFFFFFFFFFFF